MLGLNILSDYMKINGKLLHILKFAMLLLVVCWTFNLLNCLLFHSGDIRMSDIFTKSSFAFTILATLLLSYMNSKDGRV